MSELQFIKRKEPTVQLVPECQLRLQLLALAVQGGATIENAQRVASDWEEWVGSDDPLRLAVPSPDTRKCNCGPNYCDEGGCIDKKEAIGPSEPLEIDWSRPQLVKSIDGIIVETTGYHEESVHGTKTFNGYEFEVDKGRIAPCCHWYCDHFKYHGEIQQESKTTSLTFAEAMEATLNGKTVGRPNNAKYLFDGDERNCLMMETARGSLIFPVIYQDDILATDWQIITQ